MDPTTSDAGGAAEAEGPEGLNPLTEGLKLKLRGLIPQRVGGSRLSSSILDFLIFERGIHGIWIVCALHGMHWHCHCNLLNLVTC